MQLEREITARRIEAQKPFLEQQFKTYLGASAIIGRLLASLTVDHPNRNEVFYEDKVRFETLRRSEIALVAAAEVSQKVDEFESALDAYFKAHSSRAEADSILKLEDALRRTGLEAIGAMKVSIQNGWQDNVQAGSAPAAPR